MWRLFARTSCTAALFLFSAGLGTSAVIAADSPQVETISIAPPVISAAPEAEYAVPTKRDRVGRIVVPVMVNRRGPFKFILDTGANTTVLAPQLAATIGLTVDQDQMVNMNGVTGAQPVPTAEVDRVESGSVVLESQRLAIAQASLIGTDGVLGVDGLKDKLVLVDFIHDRAQVLDAREHRPAPHVVRLHARARFGRLLVVQALVGKIKVNAVIDTGGQRTLGNYALYAALGLRPSMTIRGINASIVGATDSRQQGELYAVPEITLGESLSITNLGVIFGDFYIFKLWDLEHTPTLVLGMDMIGTLDTFAVDYLRLEVQIRAGREWGTRVHVGSTVAGL